MKPFLDLITAEQAYACIGAFAPLERETIGTRESLGRVIAEEIRAADDIPHFDRSNMDGFAVRATDTAAAAENRAVLLRVSGQVAMGQPARVAVEPGTAVRVSTGAMLPAGADAVVIVERTEDAGADRIAVYEPVVAGQNLVRIGEDMRTGDVVYRPGRKLRGADVGVLTGVGLSRVDVYRLPRVGVMATGDEIVEPEDELGPGQVRNVNQYLLASFARSLGARVNDYGVVADDADTLGRTLRRACRENDAIFISGGSSKGVKDLTLAAIESCGPVEILFHGIAIAPGKPTILARRAVGTAIMGVPGNPAAAAVVWTLFGSALVRVLGGEHLEHVLATRPRIRARLTTPIRSNQGREDYLRVRVQAQPEGLPTAHVIAGKSVAISTLAQADGLLRIPLQTEGIAEGSDVDVILF